MEKQRQALSENVQAFVALVLLIMLLFFQKKYTKKDLAEMYGVEKRTLKKWVKYFCTDVDYIKFSQARTISGFTYLKIRMALGDSSKLNSMLISELVEELDSSYKTLAIAIPKFFVKRGYSQEAYNMKKFPPRISQLIINHV